jgi:hypothetical protein
MEKTDQVNINDVLMYFYYFYKNIYFKNNKLNDSIMVHVVFTMFDPVLKIKKIHKKRKMSNNNITKSQIVINDN